MPTIIKRCKPVVYLLPALFLLNVAFGQSLSNSPLTKYGIGDFFWSGPVRNYSMGGLAIGSTNPYTINIGNPASYNRISNTTFEVSAFMDASRMTGDSTSTDLSTSGVANLAFGFPIRNKSGLVFGLKPYSVTGFRMEKQYSTMIDSVSVPYNLSISGNGGLNAFYGGFSKHLFHGLSIGMNAAYTFGTTNYYWLISYDDNSYQSVRVQKRVNADGFIFGFGLNYIDTFASDSISLWKFLKSDTLTYDLKNEKITVNEEEVNTYSAKIDKFDDIVKVGDHIVGPPKFRKGYNHTGGSVLKAGIIADLPAKLVGVQRLTYDNRAVLDTIGNIQSGSIQVPVKFGFGFELEKYIDPSRPLTGLSVWSFGMDVVTQNWTSQPIFGVTNNSGQFFRGSIGGEWIPALTGKSYLKKIAFRAGAYVEQQYLTFQGNNLNVIALTAGIGIPVSRNTSRINIGAEIGNRSVSNLNYKEQFIRLRIGINLNERWFLRYKVD